MTVTKITSFEQYQQILSSSPLRPSIIDFTASWCPPCKLIKPVYHKLASDPALAAAVDFYEVDTDEQPAVSLVAGVRAMPTFVLYSAGENGELEDKGRVMGADPRGILNLLQSNLPPTTTDDGASSPPQPATTPNTQGVTA